MSVKMAPSAPHGTYNLDLSSLNHKEDELIAMRYAFKPASVTHATPGTYYPSQGSSTNQSVQVVFDVKNGSQVFDVREETVKGREYVMIFNEGNNTFELHPLSTTLHLTLNRNASHTYAASTSSTTSSSSVPLAANILHTAQEEPPEISNRAEDEGTGDGMLRLTKRARTAVVEKTGRDKGTSPPHEDLKSLKGNRGVGKGGKSLLRNKPLESAPIPVISSARTRSITTNVKNKSGKGKTTGAKSKAKGKKAEITSHSKVKSAEYIEDSDEEIGVSEEVQLPASSARKLRARGKETREQAEEEEEEEEDGMDEFANLLGQSLAEGGDYNDADAEGEDEFEEVLTQQLQQQYTQSDAALGYDDEDDDESESEDEDDELGGARLVVRQSGVMDDGSEWI
ncbi:hypothetical protein C343_03150 [Cryptococcus neoformans C23]|uniref:Transcription elongation factor Eaf N-terminal domain-containing protein n=1 Tax=Cryptococcus neoformans (strain H99 / ATCC 208821 / CBS 10515 / FGSC 9487) TaxID=235443 RepID=J9VTL5_CRYN9|nr:hypothetical protein CNAG_01086 [Cryptococcus neoformans var. grubii H99]AUB24802.1 hypothetical protein CKF44_01086 [Cryptococcus neoformans var. grubii]OWZ32514.1 hypothetical protein C347_03213 [Cryptococcus neoformans var. grubii AD2-60a]OWZ44361.1 hypothetical protein C343_03150 [Cryptococcus neoformans var. grubii C23]OXC84830.1 hypothetical protein C344_02911 [Cryptococcus neoformans var. grubii AD1-7a]OXG33899.1 hypothetical protein C360_03637 [Cryptococcus neoformans var. grubii Bt|eukprot:XP_012049065.1 hypothetical protein CNAG_01086 [Cryptococcus neoformans var. grubii H99]